MFGEGVSSREDAKARRAWSERGDGVLNHGFRGWTRMVWWAGVAEVGACGERGEYGASRSRAS